MPTMLCNSSLVAVWQLAKCLVVMAAMCGIAKPPSEPTPVKFQGTVALVLGDRVVVTTRHERRTFVVAGDALIYVNRAEANLSEIVPGQYAAISGSAKEGQLVANLIAANRQY